jgi:hypothetical protein
MQYSMLRPIVGTPRSRVLTLRCPAIGCQHEHVSNHALQVSLGLQSRRCIHSQAAHVGAIATSSPPLAVYKAVAFQRQQPLPCIVY